jgi:tetratricopeptide (TPR) repeat protein
MVQNQPALSNKYNKKSSKAGSKKERVIAEKKSVIKTRSTLHISYLHFLPLCFALCVFIIIWFRPFNVKLKDPWYEGAQLIDSARKVIDTNRRRVLLSEAGKILAEQVQKHPYHARVHYLYGFYWFDLHNWDSAIFQQKEAIRLGAGGTVNQVEFSALEMLNAALSNKMTALLNTGNLEEAAAVLEYAKTPEMFNPGIDKFRGVIYSRQGNADSALTCFLRYRASQPNDANNLTNIAIAYNQKNMRDSARLYINQALKLDPANANANLVNSQLNSQ